MTDSTAVPQTVTVSLEHEAAPQRVVATISDGTRLPQWSPKFADRVERTGEGWTVTRGDTSFPVTIAVVPEAGVADILLHRDGALGFGARFRAMPRDDGGSVITMTMPSFGDVAASTHEAEQELAALGELLD